MFYKTIFVCINRTLDTNAGATLLSYSRQIASAMVYLSAKGFIHRDLAARNILVSMDGICKVSEIYTTIIILIIITGLDYVQSNRRSGHGIEYLISTMILLTLILKSY